MKQKVDGLRVGQRRRMWENLTKTYRIVEIDERADKCLVVYKGEIVEWTLRNCRRDPLVKDFSSALKEITDVPEGG